MLIQPGKEFILVLSYLGLSKEKPKNGKNYLI